VIGLHVGQIAVCRRAGDYLKNARVLQFLEAGDEVAVVFFGKGMFAQ
jgi:hypothetical protein